MEFKEAFERDHKTARDNRIALENKRKSDHIMFDRFVKNACQKKTDLEEKYAAECLEHAKLQEE